MKKSDQFLPQTSARTYKSDHITGCLNRFPILCFHCLFVITTKGDKVPDRETGDEARVAFSVFSRELFGVDGFIIVWRLFWRISIVLLDSCLSSKALEMSSLQW